MVVEADEFDRSFLTLNPDIAIISSMDADHLDIYETKDHLTESFLLFQDKVKSCGKLIIKNGLQVSNNLKCAKVIYAIDNDVDISASNIRVEDGKFHYDLNFNYNEERSEAHFKQNIPGRHNIENAIAAIAVCEILGLNQEKTKEALESYKGVERRFDYKIKTPDLVYIDDYAHHPEEIKACINTVKELYPDKKITGVFQPHLYTRTRDFADEFAESLELLDNLILLEIYPARELPIEGVSSKMLYDKINLKSKTLCNKTEVIEILGNMEIEIIVTLGAGDIDQLVNPIQEFFTKRTKE